MEYLLHDLPAKHLRRLFGRKRVPDVIWFSRDVQAGVLRRWMIVVKSCRIMLIRRADGMYDFKMDAIYAWTPEQECEKLAREGRVVLHPTDRHALVRIGDTTRRRQEVSDRFDAVRDTYPSQFTWTQCQTFLRQLATSIVERPDWEWEWFLGNTDTAVQNLTQLPPLPAHLLAAFEADQRQQHQAQAQGANAAIWAGRQTMQLGVANQIQQQNAQIQQQVVQNSRN